jgi:hypothetical protein
LTENGFRVVRVRPSHDDTENLVMVPVADLALPNLPGLPTQSVAAAVHALADMGVARARIDSLRGYTPEQSMFVREICRKLGR